MWDKFWGSLGDTESIVSAPAVLNNLEYIFLLKLYTLYLL